MRNAFAEEIMRLAELEKRLVLLSGDIGNRLFDGFKAKYPERFFNCGVAEANMTGVAAGLAMSGLRPVTYTIAPFATTRCLEQIRNDICYHDLPVTIVGVGSGLGYAELGATHQSLEDIALLRSIPNMTVLCPADPIETRFALQASLNQNHPVYLRIGKKGEPAIHKSTLDYSIGKAIKLRAGSDMALLTTGVIAPLAMAIAKTLSLQAIEAEVLHFPSVKPLDEHALSYCLKTYDVVASLEEHSRIGGFGAAIAELTSDMGCDLRRLLRFGTQDVFLHEAGDMHYARNRHGLSLEPIINAICCSLNNQNHLVC